MKKLLFFLIPCLCVLHARATDVTAHCTIQGGQSIRLHPHFNGGRTGTEVDSVRCTILLDAGYVSGAGNTVDFAVLPYGIPNSPTLLNAPVTLPASAAANTQVVVTLALQTANTPDTIRNDLNGFIVLNGNPGTFLTVILSPGSTYHPDKPFWVEVGANFDLVDDIKPDNVFTGVFFYQRDIRPVFRTHSRSSNLAFCAGLYESKASSYSNGRDNTPVSFYDSSSFLGRVNDSLRAVRYTNIGKVKNQIEIRNIGMFLSPQLRLTNGSANANGAHFFFSFYAEIQWQQIRNNYDYSGTTRVLSDTLRFSNEQLARADTLLFPARPEGKPVNVFSHYEGVGLPVFIKTSDVNLYINPVFGMSNQPKTPDVATLEGITDNTLSRDWRPFYLVQFRLSEETYGLSLSGEVRGLLDHHSPPFITLLLSKKFDLTRIMRFR